ncbi:hypothetical protein L1987_11267 [Smallanthus sonchifolius]|uniref:Uncharacterized protein n=1 Tax=Smallanthus sonchifolius TaxID=185202 RepID=A0ACB9JBD7_9ASTR|nr:hypothetical protein L1987_11267 [Smallanthus sonchifolius]
MKSFNFDDDGANPASILIKQYPESSKSRLKELIKYKRYQVPPAELEHILHSHPGITEAAVIPYPDESAGQVPMGFLVKRRGSTINETQVKDYVAKQVAPYKKLRRVCFTDSIPKNAPGKLLRKELIKMAVNSRL